MGQNALDLPNSDDLEGKKEALTAIKMAFREYGNKHPQTLGGLIQRMALADELSFISRAVALCAEHPDWTDKQIAAVAGCSTRTLRRSDMYRRARIQARAQRDEHPKGWRTQDGRVDGVAPQ